MPAAGVRGRLRRGRIVGTVDARNTHGNEIVSLITGVSAAGGETADYV